jgi:hypothetical protein
LDLDFFVGFCPYEPPRACCCFSKRVHCQNQV